MKRKIVFTLLMLGLLAKFTSLTYSTEPVAFENKRISDKLGTVEYTALMDAEERSLTNGFYRLDDGEQTDFFVNVSEEGYYNLEMVFRPDVRLISYIDISVLVNDEVQFDEADNLRVYVDWESGGNVIDRYGNENVSMQKIIDKEYKVKLIDANGDDVYPYAFYFKKGENKITVTNLVTDFYIGQINLCPINYAPDYSEYVSANSGAKLSNTLTEVEAEDAISKNRASIFPESLRDPSITPYDTYTLRLNIMGGDAYYEPGSEAKWRFEVPEDGFYYFSFKMKQTMSEAANAPVFRTIKIDGEIPFAQMESYKFNFTSKWKNIPMQDGNGEKYRFYLTKGEHELTITIDNSIFAPVEKIMLDMADEISDTALNIKKMTGNVEDRYRDWDLEEFMPDINERLESWVNRLEYTYNYLLSVSGKDTKYATFTAVALQTLKNLAMSPNDLPNRLSSLATGQNSVVDGLNNVLDYIKYQPMAMDKFYVHGETALPKTEVSFFTKAIESTKRFFRTFSPESYGNIPGATKHINVWVNRSRSYVNLLQQMTDTEFTPKTGIEVNFSIMPDEKKIILSNASKTNPDAGLGVTTGYPYELAMRDAVLDLSKMDGFYETAKNYQPGAFVSYIVDDSFYALPETQDFWLLFYRKDILEHLGLSIPETWDQVIQMLPTLQRYGMNFATNLSTFEAYKPFSGTVPYIYQNGGTLIHPDGRSTSINEESAIKGIKFMTDLFNIYSTPQRVASLYVGLERGDIPVGIGSFATYLQMTFGSTNLKGKWDVALMPGIEDANGNINRTVPGAATCSLIFQNSKHEEAWEFLKWYSSVETQTSYGNMLSMTYGDGYIWNTANIKAFENMIMPVEHRRTVLKQWESLVELPRVPGYYMLERELSNIWNRVVIDGVSVREAVDDSTILIDREIERKMEEFNFIVDGKMVKEFQYPSVERIKNLIESGGNK